MSLLKGVGAFFRKNCRRLWFSVFVNAVFLILLVLILRPYYETNDDISLQSFFNGARHVQDGYTRISNYIFGWAMSVLYRITAQLPWYTLYLYAIVFVSLTSVTYFILSEFQDHALGTLLTAIVLISFGYHGYIAVNFTKIAGIGAAAGAFLIVRGMEEKKGRRWRVLIGTALFFAGYILRPRQGLACAGLITAAGLYILLRLKSSVPKGKRARELFIYILCLIPALLLIAGAEGADRYALNSDERRQAYDSYCMVRVPLVDYGFPAYRRNKEEFEKLDINENAWNLYKHWDFFDTEKMPADTMAQIVSLQQEYRLSAKVVSSFAGEYPGKAFRNPVFAIYLLVLLLCLWYGKREKAGLLTILYQVLLLTACYFYLFYRRRYGLHRVEDGLLFACILTLLPLLREGRVRIRKNTAVILAVCVLLFSQREWYQAYRRQTIYDRAKMVNYRNYTSMLSNDRDHLYLVQVLRFFPDNAYGPFDRVPVDSLYNIAPLGGWTAMSIPYNSVYERYGVTNPYRDMIGNDSIRLVTEDPEVILTYLQDYYDVSCSVEKVGEIGTNNIYRIVRAEKGQD